MKNEFDLKAGKWDSDPDKIERAKAVADAIMKKIQPSSEFTALEYGSGTGLVSFFLQPFLKKIVLADSSKGMLEVAQSKIEKSSIKNMFTVELDLTESNPPDEKFDLIYTLLAMHHVSDISVILSKFFTMLKKNGFLCIADLDKEDGSFHGEGFTGHHGFDRRELTSYIEKAGFYNIEFETVCKLTRKNENGQEREFPIFLVTSNKGVI